MVASEIGNDGTPRRVAHRALAADQVLESYEASHHESHSPGALPANVAGKYGRTRSQDTGCLARIAQQRRAMLLGVVAVLQDTASAGSQHSEY